MQKNIVNIFISYAAADNGIANALKEELESINRGRIVCFLDTESIRTGEKWEPAINAALEKADWLVCIYTGEQSEFCGYEIGVFSKAKANAAGSGCSRLVCLHDVESLPAVFRSHQNRMVVYPPRGRSPMSPTEEQDHYGRLPLADFFRDIYAYEGLYPADLSERQIREIVRQVKTVTNAFQEATALDIRSDTPTQLGLQITVAAPAGNRLENVAPLESIPAEAEVSGTFESFGLFNLMPALSAGPVVGQVRFPASTWGKIREAAGEPDRTAPPWILRLEKDMIDAANERSLSGPEATFKSRSKIYRSILTRYVAFHNGMRRFQVIFVETLPRLFLGEKQTSLLLAGIVLAARFRFAYIEQPADVAAKFATTLPHATFERNCRQLLYDLDRYQDEAFEHGLLNAEQLSSAFGAQRRAFVEGILGATAEHRRTLLSALPRPGEVVDDNNRPAIHRAITTYLRQTEPINRDFLITALEALREEIDG